MSEFDLKSERKPVSPPVIEDEYNEREALSIAFNHLIELTESPGYAHFMVAIAESLRHKQNELISSPDSFEHENTRTYIAGETNALKWVMELADGQISAITTQLDMIKLKEDNANE